MTTPVIKHPAMSFRRHISAPVIGAVSVHGRTTAHDPPQSHIQDFSLSQLPPDLAMPIDAARSDQAVPTDLIQRHSSMSVSAKNQHLFPTYQPGPSPFTINPVITPLIGDPTTARSFEFYLRHSGSAMGARSSPSFFLSTIPQVASNCTHVRYALLAVSLVDESVNDHATDNGKYGPGVECVDQEARKVSFEMYGLAVRTLVKTNKEETPHPSAVSPSSLTNIEIAHHDDALAATLITCLLLFSFEYWLWNHRNAARHLEGAVGLMQSYERSIVAGRARGKGILEEKVLPMMRQAARYHDMSLTQGGVPASKFGKGATWKPETSGGQVVAV
jgi:hypothetical protein